MPNPQLAAVGHDLTPLEQDLSVTHKGTTTIVDGFTNIVSGVTETFKGIIVGRPQKEFTAGEPGFTVSGDGQLIVRDGQTFATELAIEDVVTDEKGLKWMIESERDYDTQFGVTIWVLVRER